MPRRRTPARELAARLASWFHGAKRTLPWRAPAGRARDPYRTWLSEIMLQQTRVAVVEDYFARFIARFPDVRSLAGAHEDDVLALWSGLGYYSRGRNLHRAARVIVDAHGGSFPRTAAELRALPGVGPYTASAVASLAFGERTAVVDGNVARVLARLGADATPVDSSAGRAAITGRAQALIEAAEDPAVHNEALMELGALVCTPRSPACGACPWRRECAAHSSGDVLAYPKKSPRRARKPLAVACLVVTRPGDGDAVWLEKREGRGLFGGLYEPPAQEVSDPTSDTEVEAAWSALAAARGLGAPRRWPGPIRVERTLTHRDLVFIAARLEAPASADGAFVARADVARVGTSTAVRALLSALWPGQAERAQPELFS